MHPTLNAYAVTSHLPIILGHTVGNNVGQADMICATISNADYRIWQEQKPIIRLKSVCDKKIRLNCIGGNFCFKVLLIHKFEKQEWKIHINSINQMREGLYTTKNMP